MRAKVNCARCGRSMGEVALLGSEDPASPRPRYCGDSGCKHPALRREPEAPHHNLAWLRASAGRFTSDSAPKAGGFPPGGPKPEEAPAPAPKVKVKRPDELDEQQRAKVRRRLAEGASNTTIARELGVDVGLVWVEQSRAHQEESMSASDPKVRKRAVEMVREGRPTAEIMAELGAPKRRISAWARAAGISAMQARQLRQRRAEEEAAPEEEPEEPSPPTDEEPEDHPHPRDLEDEDEAPEEIEAPAPDRPSTIYGRAREAAERAPEAAPAEEVEELRRKVEELERELSAKAKAIPALDRDCAAAMKRAREADARVAELEQLLEDERRKSDSRITLAAPKTCPDCGGRLDADGDCPPCLFAAKEPPPAPQPTSGLRAIGAAAWEALCAAREERDRRALSGVMEACIAGLGIDEQRG